jgi:hypothetical protein
MGTLIRHARGLPAAATVIALTIAMIEPSFGALLVAAVGAPSLVEAGLLTALGVAVALSAIAVRADEEHCVTLVTEANSLPEYRFAMNGRHASSQAGLDNDRGFVAGWNQLSLVLPVEWLPNSEPCRSNGRVPSASAFDDKILRSADDRTDDCAFGAMMSLPPAKVQKNYVFR